MESKPQRFVGLTNSEKLELGRKIADDIEREVFKVVKGPELRGLIKLLIVAILADGHVLVRGPIGLGKTLACTALAKTIGGVFNKRQFTPDMLPSELTGYPFYNQKIQEFVTRHGPLYGANTFLADEINRGTPKIQSGLLAAMEEQHLTIDNQVYELQPLFTVLATRNPMENEGVYQLPEAQLDRFMAQYNVDRVSEETLMEILSAEDYWRPSKNRLEPVNQVTTPEEIMALRETIFTNVLLETNLFGDQPMVQYAAKLVLATWSHPSVKFGSSPRGGINLQKAATVVAFREGPREEGRYYVVPEDMQRFAVEILAHRIFIEEKYRSNSQHISLEIIKEILDAVKPTS